MSINCTAGYRIAGVSCILLQERPGSGYNEERLSATVVYLHIDTSWHNDRQTGHLPRGWTRSYNAAATGGEYGEEEESGGVPFYKKPNQ